MQDHKRIYKGKMEEAKECADQILFLERMEYDLSNPPQYQNNEEDEMDSNNPCIRYTIGLCGMGGKQPKDYDEGIKLDYVGCRG